MSDMKTCSLCKEDKDIVDFAKFKHSKDGYATYCKKCKHTNWNSKRTKRERQIEHLKLTYGLSEEQYLQLLKDQDYACPICLKDLKPFDKGTHVDHCHEGGHVRSILCGICNKNLGHYEKFKRENLIMLFEEYLKGGL